jgi:hypothetical protein
MTYKYTHTTDIIYQPPQGRPSQTVDGTTFYEFMPTNPDDEANDLFDNWFRANKLRCGIDYVLDTRPGKPIVIRFKNFDDLKFYEYRTGGAA